MPPDCCDRATIVARGQRLRQQLRRLLSTNGGTRLHRQPFEGIQTRPLPPPDLRLVDRQLQARPALKQGFQRTFGFEARELMAEAEMNAGAKGDMAVRPALQVETLRTGIVQRIHAGRRPPCPYLFAPAQHAAAQVRTTADTNRP